MQRFTTHIGRVVALPRVNVDTDQIIPKQFLRSIERTGFGAVLFYDWRYDTDGDINPEFELNRPAAANATVLLAGINFGCGSSREHARVGSGGLRFSLHHRGIFRPTSSTANCGQNGILPVALPSSSDP